MVTLPDIDDRPLSFGKYKGQSPNEIAEDDPSYITWIYENVEPCPVSTELYEACALDIAEDESAQWGPEW
jgi:hypothetical protein